MLTDIFADRICCKYFLQGIGDGECYCCLNPSDAWDCDGLKGRVTECCHGLRTEAEEDFYWSLPNEDEDW